MNNIDVSTMFYCERPVLFQFKMALLKVLSNSKMGRVYDLYKPII